MSRGSAARRRRMARERAAARVALELEARGELGDPVDPEALDLERRGHPRPVH